MESRNILAKNQISPHTLSTTDFYKIVYYSHLLHSIITALYYFIKLAPQVTISYPKWRPKTNEDFYNDPPAKCPLLPGNDQLPSKENKSKKLR